MCLCWTVSDSEWSKSLNLPPIKLHHTHTQMTHRQKTTDKGSYEQQQRKETQATGTTKRQFQSLIRIFRKSKETFSVTLVENSNHSKLLYDIIYHFMSVYRYDYFFICDTTTWLLPWLGQLLYWFRYLQVTLIFSIALHTCNTLYDLCITMIGSFALINPHNMCVLKASIYNVDNLRLWIFCDFLNVTVYSFEHELSNMVTWPT